MKSEKEKIKLVLVSQEMRNKITDYRASFLNNGEPKIDGSAGLHKFEAFDDWFSFIKNPPEGRVPSSTFAALRLPDNVIVGMADIRHYLSEAIYHNGHIGYSVRPGERGHGYGTEILRQALIKAEHLGIIETVVTCDSANRASKKVITGNRLKFQNQFIEENGNTILIYTT